MVENESEELRIQKSRWGLFWSNLWLVWLCIWMVSVFDIRGWIFWIFTIPLLVFVAMQTKYGRWR